METMSWREEASSLRAYRRAERSFDWNWHYHPEIELTLITRGTGTRLVGDHSANYQAGDLVLLGSNLPHTWFSREPGAHEAIVIQFLASAYPAELLGLPEFKGIGTLLGQAGLGVRFHPDSVRVLERRMRALTGLNGVEAWLELTSLLGTLAMSNGEVLADASYRNQRSFKMGSRLGRIIEHVEEGCEGELSLGDMALFAGLTPSSFARYFRKMTGRTFVEFRNSCRLRKACRKLGDTDQSILEIALGCGFQNLAHFNQQFRKFVGLTPREYRKLRSQPQIPN